MGEKQLPRWKRVTGFVAFCAGLFLLFFVATFPYSVLEERLVAEAAKQGYVLTIGSVGPGFFGLTLNNVEISSPATPGAETPPAALPIDKLSLRPSVFPLGVAFRATMLGGTVSGAVGWLRDLSLDLSAKSIALDDPRLRQLAGVDLVGELKLDASFELPVITPAKGRRYYDPSRTEGKFNFDLTGARVNGGKITIALPNLGGAPTPIPLEKINLGDITGKVTFAQGKGTIDTLRSSQGADIELLGTGTVQLAKNFQSSAPNIDLKVKAEDEVRGRLGMLGMAISALPKDPQSPNFRIARIGGTFKGVRLRPR